MTADALELLSGDAQAFVTKVWASHVHLHHADPAALAALLSLDDVDHLVTSTALRAPALRVAKDGGVLPSSRYTRPASLAGQPLTGLVDPRKLLALFDDGATVVLQGLHRSWPPLTRLVRSLELSLGHPCQANAYLTPPGSQGFALHSDTHDVFVLQTHGTKLWEVHDEAGPREVRLEPGTSMYLPTGTPHAARAQQSASLHVTIGINRITWREALTRAVARMLDDAAYGEPLPAGYLENPTSLAEEVSDRLRTLSTAVAGADPDAIVSAESHRFLTTRNPELRGGLHDRLADIGDDTELARRETVPCALVPDGDRLRVLLGDHELRVPARLRAPLEHVAAHRTVRPRELAGWLDEDSRLVLTRRLVREGLLRVMA